MDNIHQREAGTANEVFVRVNGQVCLSLVDTGSAVTTITEDFVHSHPELRHQQRSASNIKFENSSGFDVPYN